MFVRVKKIGGYQYLYLVENAREGGRHVQRAIKVLGRRDEVEAAGTLDSLIVGGTAFAALDRAVEHPGIPAILSGELRILFWLARELGWWWVVGVMLAVLIDFLWDSPILTRMVSLFDRVVVRAR